MNATFFTVVFYEIGICRKLGASNPQAIPKLVKSEGDPWHIVAPLQLNLRLGFLYPPTQVSTATIQVKAASTHVTRAP